MKMWYQVLKQFLIFQRFTYIRLLYNPKTVQFSVNRKSSQMFYWTMLQIHLLLIVSFYRVFCFVTFDEEKASSAGYTFAGLVLDLLWFVEMAVVLARQWTWRLKANETVWFLNQLISFKSKQGKSIHQIYLHRFKGTSERLELFVLQN